MAIPMNVRVLGLEKTLANLKSKTEEIKHLIDAEMGAAMEEMATHAKQKFPIPPSESESQEYSFIRASIRVEKQAPYIYKLVAGYGNNPKNPDHALAAYIEFGTGPKFQNYIGKEKEWQTLASQYFISGKGWMMPSPYFYPAVTVGYQKLLISIKSIIDRNERL